MIFRGDVVSASKIKSSPLSLDERSISLMALFDKFISDHEKLVLTQDYGQESFFRYKICRKRLLEFLQNDYKSQLLP